METELRIITANKQTPHEKLTYENKCKICFHLDNIFSVYKGISYGWFLQDLPHIGFYRTSLKELRKTYFMYNNSPSQYKNVKEIAYLQFKQPIKRVYEPITEMTDLYFWFKHLY